MTCAATAQTTAGKLPSSRRKHTAGEGVKLFYNFTADRCSNKAFANFQIKCFLTNGAAPCSNFLYINAFTEKRSVYIKPK